MRKVWCVALLAGLGSGGHADAQPYPYIYWQQAPAAVLPAGPRGITVLLPMELTGEPIRAVEGELKRQEALAVHTLRAADARVLVTEARDQKRVLPAGTALARLTPGDGDGQDLWCDLHPYGRVYHDCLADSDGDGRFDQFWSVVSNTRLSGLTPAAGQSPRVLAAPAMARAATPEERPALELGFSWCGGDGLQSPPRFALAVRTPGETSWATAGQAGCAFGVWPDPADRQRVDLGGGITLKASADATTEVLSYRVEGRLAPVVRLAALEPAALPKSLGAPTPSPTESGTPRPPRALIQGEVGPGAMAGPLAKGEAFFTVAVRHALTGTLRTEVSGAGLLAARPLLFGQPVYGLPMGGSISRGTVWCAPRRESNGWRAYCLPQTRNGNVWVEAKPALMTLSLAWDPGTARLASPPDVQPGPITLPPMTLSYAFDGWTDSGAAKAPLQIDWGEGPKTLRSLVQSRGPDGAAHFKWMDGEVVLRPGARPNAATAEIVSPPRPGAVISY